MTNQTPAEALDDILRKIDKCIEDGEGVGYDYYGGNIMADEPFTLSDIKVAITAYAATVERDKQLQGQLHEVSMALAVYENNPPEIYKYLLDRKELVWNGLKEHRLAALQGPQDGDAE